LQRLPQPTFGPSVKGGGTSLGRKGTPVTVPCGAAGPVRLRTRAVLRAAQRHAVHGSINAKLLTGEIKPCVEMPYAATDGSRACHRSLDHTVCLAGNLLERRLSRGCPWLSGRFVASILAHEENSRERNFEIGPALCRTDQR
jgi:hypothetical protein